MNTIYKMQMDERRYDFTAVKILLSAIAILLSVTLADSLAPKVNSINYEPSILDKIFDEFENRNFK